MCACGSFPTCWEFCYWWNSLCACCRSSSRRTCSERSLKSFRLRHLYITATTMTCATLSTGHNTRSVHLRHHRRQSWPLRPPHNKKYRGESIFSPPWASSTPKNCQRRQKNQNVAKTLACKISKILRGHSPHTGNASPQKIIWIDATMHHWTTELDHTGCVAVSVGRKELCQCN